MIPLIDLFEEIRKQKRFTKKLLGEHLGMDARVMQHIYNTKVIPRELIYSWALFLEIDVHHEHTLTQYNERELLHRELTELMKGRIKKAGIIDKVALILFFNVQVDVPIAQYISKLYPLPRQLDEILIDKENKD